MKQSMTAMWRQQYLRFGLFVVMIVSLATGSRAKALDQWDTVTPSGTSGYLFNAVAAMNDTVFLATDHGVYRSLNKGTAWSALNTGLGNQDVRAIAIGWIYDGAANGGNGGYIADSSTPVFAATAGGVYQTTMGGSSWTSASSGLTDTNVKDIQFDQSLVVGGTATALYAATPSGVFRSDDTGATWAAVNTGLSGQSITRLATDFGRGEVYALTASNRLYESAAFSVSGQPENWSLAYNAGSTVLRDVAMLNPIGSIHWVAAGATVLKSNDLGTLFPSHSDGLPGSAVNAVISDYTDSNIAYVGLQSHGVYRTLNEALSSPEWQPLNKNLTDMTIRDVVTNPASSLLTYATGASGVYRLELSSLSADLTPPAAPTGFGVQ
jgi:ligand-binding sensor domain-containing protein